jgi:hypothetical protein
MMVSISIWDRASRLRGSGFARAGDAARQPRIHCTALDLICRTA